MPTTPKAMPTPDDDAFYPCSDGEPMSDNMWQGKAILNAASDLETARPQALVAEDILLYPKRGDRGRRIAPDVLAAFGIGTHKRMSYLVWKEGKPPDWVLEVASPRSATRDLDDKRIAYAEIGVPEYWLFDAKSDIFPKDRPRLQGLRLNDGAYQALESRVVDGKRMIRSEVLGLDIQADGELIRFRDPTTGQDVPHRHETEARVAELEATLVRLRAGSDDRG